MPQAKNTKNSNDTNDTGAALTLMLLAPLITEVLPGATRLSSIFVLPIEMVVWGGGALLIRYALRRWQLGWSSMLLMALALALAEECIIQQTSVAPLVVHIRGVEYARAFGINYVYLIWALVYEATFVVVVPIYLVELIFPARRQRLWISKGGMFAVIPLFILGSFLAWFSWTRIARPKFFHLPVYTPPMMTTVIALLVIIGLIVVAMRNRKERSVRSVAPPPGWLLFIVGGLWSTALFGLLLMAFGIAPGFPPVLSVCWGLALLLIALLLVRRWTTDTHCGFILVFGTILGSMLVTFTGFGGGKDLYFKIFIDFIALVLLILLGKRILTSPHVIE
jgi:uncharacterized membrane protein